MIGNYLEFKGDKTEDNLVLVRKWVKVIFDSLIIEVEEKKA